MDGSRMKVNIGPYKSWFGPYQLAEKLMFWVPREKDEHGFEHTAKRVHDFGEWLAYGSVEPEPEVGDIRSFTDKRKITLLYKFLLWVESKRKRKVEIRIDRWDTWSMDHTLAEIILPMLKQLKETKHGYPASLSEKKWDDILDQMIFSFESKVNDDWESQFYTGEPDFQFKQLEDGMSEMVEGPNHTSVFDKEGYEAYAKRIQKGFTLFGKYYQNLWD